MLKLDTNVTDLATGQKGVLDQMNVHMGGSSFYLFQPAGVDKATGKPIKRFWMPAARIAGGLHIEEPSLPHEVLGTIVEDKTTGFKGMAISFTLHSSGCVHVNVQPRAKDDNTESPEDHNFDIRSLKGKAITAMTERELEKDKKDKPSPGGYVRFGTRG